MSTIAVRFLYGIPILGGVVGLIAWDQVRGGSAGITILALVLGCGGALEIASLGGLGRPFRGLALLLCVGSIAAGAWGLGQPGSLSPALEASALLLAVVPGFLFARLLRSSPPPRGRPIDKRRRRSPGSDVRDRRNHRQLFGSPERPLGGDVGSTAPPRSG